MPLPLMIFYRALGAILLVLAAVMLWEKYRTVHGGTLLPARILECRRADGTNPHAAAGGYRYVVELYINGERCKVETNDSFFTAHDKQVGQTITVWYKEGRPTVERQSYGTEVLAAAIIILGVVLLLLQ